jgi:lipopolysaccharide/colanic/teichoic acid biosynthesis glycosyltransferase
LEVIGFFFLAALGILAAALSRQLTDEFKAWAPWIIKYIIDRAVRQLPEDQRERFAEEWPSHVNEVPGDISKLLVACGFFIASLKISGRLGDISSELGKRMFDVTFSTAAGLFLFPLFMVILIITQVSSPGPVFVRRVCVGFRGNQFYVLRFRTSETTEGALVRRTALDELPQLMNVLRGEMSLVGPRPCPLDSSSDESQSFLRHHLVKPGITGLAQVGGLEAIDVVKQKQTNYDLYYVENWSLLLDFQILAKTVRLTFFGKKAN